jgi:hypothetical protein
MVAMEYSEAFFSCRMRMRAILIAAACLTQLGWYGHAKAAPESTATLETLGRVQVLREGKPLSARRGLRLRAGDEVTTDINGYALIHYASGERVYLKPDTQVRVGSIFVVFGEAFLRVKDLFRVDSDFVTAGVEGTEFSFQMIRMGAITVTVREGIVVCSSVKGLWAPVRMQTGERLIAIQDEAPQVIGVSREELHAETGWVDELEAHFRRQKKPPAEQQHHYGY